MNKKVLAFTLASFMATQSTPPSCRNASATSWLQKVWNGTMVLAESWFAYDFVKACLPNSIFWNTLSSIDALLSQGSLNENTRKIVKGQKNSLLVTFGAEGLATLDLPVRIYNIISENKKSESQRNREKESSEKVNPNQEL